MFNILNVESCYYNIPHIIYYSHIATIIFPLIIGFFVFLQNRKFLLNKLLLFLIITLSLWSVLDLILWVNFDSRIIMFIWSIIILMDLLIYISSFYLLFIFINKKDVKFIIKSLFFLSILPIIIFMPTEFMLKGFDMVSCNGIDGFIAKNYLYSIEALILFLMIIFVVQKVFKNQDIIERKKIIYFSIGLLFFLFVFLTSNLIASIFETDNTLWSFTQYSLFVLLIFIGLLTYLIVKHQIFNIKLIASQALVAGLVILIGSQFFFIQNFTNKILTGITLFLAIVFGWILVKSVKKEVSQREQIEKLSKYKSELLSIVSHQIKNPLAVVKGYATLVGDNTITEPAKIKETFLKVKAATDKLLDLLANLLDFGHIEDGKMHYSFQQIDLNKMLKETIDDFSFLAQQKNLEITFESAPADVFISGDVYKLTQVFRNLIDNSIKYTPSGWIKTKIITANDPRLSSSNEVLVEISDSGRGMSKELVEKLFSKFMRGGDEKQILGSGLGLYICKQIVEDHKGKIWAESDGESKGSRFCVKLLID